LPLMQVFFAKASKVPPVLLHLQQHRRRAF
jgi:hypothetical protein